VTDKQVVRDVTVRSVVVPLGRPLATKVGDFSRWPLLLIDVTTEQGWAHPVLARPFEVRDGQLHLPDVPGNGLEWDEDAVARFQADQ
jgi:L-alanine-DL-glutamate epimerase-like enolase superfamily enzyme